MNLNELLTTREQLKIAATALKTAKDTLDRVNMMPNVADEIREEQHTVTALMLALDMAIRARRRADAEVTR
jgi:hypothetical protein